MRPTLHVRFSPLIAGILAACGGPTTNPVPVPPPPTSAYAGTYATRVTLVQNACGSVIVQDNPTVVTHQSASGSVTFSHAGQTYAGTVTSTGSFTTTPKVVDVSDGFLYTISLTGQFGTSAFEADATVDRASTASGTCRFVVHWAGTR